MVHNKKFLTGLIIIICIALVFILGGCAKEDNLENKRGNESTEKTKDSISSKEITIEDFKQKLAENDIIIQEETTKMGNYIGAKEGYGYEINDNVIEIYKFDDKSTEQLTVENIKMAKEEGKIKMPAFNNIEYDVIYNKGLILLNYKGHPLENKIVQIFKGL